MEQELTRFVFERSNGSAQALDMVWDAVIVGAGPAGSLAACRLARRGWRVLLVEKAEFPRDKVCGACLNRAGLQVLERAGLLPQVRSGMVPLARFCLMAAGRPMSVPLPGSAAISRRRLDAELACAAVEAGAVFMTGTTARLGGVSASGRTIDLQQADSEHRVEARFVVAASGLSSALFGRTTEFETAVVRRSRIGLGAEVHCPEPDFSAGTIWMGATRGGYAGVVRLDADTINIAAAVDPSALAGVGAASELVGQLLAGAGLPVPAALNSTRFQGTPALTRSTRPVAGGRVLLVGDAAGYVEPFTGEGMGWALSGAWNLSELLIRSGPGSDPRAVEETWRRFHEQTVVRHQRWCRRISGALRWPALVRGAVCCLAGAPRLARPLAAVVSGSAELIEECG